MKTKLYDLIIIGSGPGGLTAGIYASRYNLNSLIIGKIPGGTMSEAHKICNYPSQNNISGFELTQKMVEHVKELHGNILQEEVMEIKHAKNKFIVKTNKKEYFAKRIILATGRIKRFLGVKGEKEFKGKGVSYCATCDGPLYRDKAVGVVGGGNAAVTAALLLAEHSKKVYIIHRGTNFPKAEPAWVEQLNKEKRIKQIFKEEVQEIYGDEKTGMQGVKLSNGKDLKLDGIFIEIGSYPDPKCLQGIKLEKKGMYVVVDKNQRTSYKGVLAIGDITNNVLKQVITAAAEGAVAANTVYEELKLER
jgi:thioredoxin-disulfide reductase